jgi:hypothetical protein
VLGLDGKEMIGATFDSTPLHRSKLCPRCGTEFGPKSDRSTDMSNFRKKKFCTPACGFANTRAQGPERFWAKVDKTPTCWLYTGFKKWDGYGWVARHLDGKPRFLTAHRYAWTLANGEPPAGLSIMHICDVPACCNPAHLRLGTHQENMADMKAKGRGRQSTSPKESLLHPDRVRPVRVTRSGAV